MLAVLTPYNDAWAISKNKTTANSTDRTDTKNKRAALAKVGRKFVAKNVYLNDAMTDAMIETVGLDPHDHTRSKQGKPEFIPSMTYQPNKPNGILAYHRQGPDEAGVSLRGLPAGCSKVKVVYLICDKSAIPSVLDPLTFPNNKVGARSPISIACGAINSGKSIITAGCYVSETGVDGDFSSPETNTIP